MDQAGIALGATVVGTIVGFILSQIGTWLRDRQTKQDTAKSVRTMIRIEIDQNLRLLKDFWAVVEAVQDTENIPVQRARNFTSEQFPAWESKVIDSQMTALPVAFHADVIENILRCYRDFKRLEQTRNEFDTVTEKYVSARRIYSDSSAMTPYRAAMSQGNPFGDKVERDWPACEGLIKEVLARGNPVGL